ncbi:hypothetical protein MASR1M32_08650 [Rhodobacter sp.]
MRMIARLFSALFLLALLAAAAAIWLPPAVPPGPGPGPPDQILPEVALSGALDRILIEKSARRITLFQKGRPVRIWPMALGFSPEGDKEREGDGRTPRAAI